MKNAWKLDHYLYGITQGYMAKRDFLTSEAGRASTLEISQTGVKLVTLVVNQFMDNVRGMNIFPDNVHTVSDEDLIRHIDFLHELGYEVMLKPMVDPLDGQDRAFIHNRPPVNVVRGYGTSPDPVTPWFDSYRHFMRRYAAIAEKTNVEIFCVGCEFLLQEDTSAEWLKVLECVREIYSGIVTYNMQINVEEFTPWRKPWFSQLDLLGISGYFKLDLHGREPTLDNMVELWEGWATKIKAFAQFIGRPVFFAETGTRPMENASFVTGDCSLQGTRYCEEEQSNYYEAMQIVFEKYPWFYGTVWWKHDEHQDRDSYHLQDGHYIGMTPTPMLKNVMKARASQTISRPEILPGELKTVEW